MIDASSLSSPVRQLGTVERAFVLARSGSCQTVPEVAALLKRENHEAVDAHLAGPAIRKDLQRLCVAARTRRHENDGVAADAPC